MLQGREVVNTNDILEKTAPLTQPRNAGYRFFVQVPIGQAGRSRKATTTSGQRKTHASRNQEIGLLDFIRA